MLASAFPRALGWTQKTSSSPSAAPQERRSLTDGCGVPPTRDSHLPAYPLDRSPPTATRKLCLKVPRSQLCSQDSGVYQHLAPLLTSPSAELWPSLCQAYHSDTTSFNLFLSGWPPRVSCLAHSPENSLCATLVNSCSVPHSPSFRSIGSNHAGHPVQTQIVLCLLFSLDHDGTSK